MADKKLFLLSPEIYVSASTALGGPPAQLFNMYVAKRNAVGFVITPWVKDQMEKQLIEAGMDDEAAARQSTFVASLGHSSDDPETLGEDPLVSIATHLGLDAVYHASGRGEEVVEGIKFSPVHELMEIIKEL